MKMPTKTTRHTSRKAAETRRKQLDTLLVNLTQAELIRALLADEPEYSFKHALVQDSAQSSLLLHDRKRLHLQVAHAFETVFQERCIDEYAQLLVGHYAAAGEDQKTLDYARIAGDQAFRVYALAEAISFYTQAIDAATRLPNTPTSTLIHLFYQRGQALLSNSQWQLAWTNYEAMEQAAQERQDRTLELWSLVERTVLRSVFSPLFEPNDAQMLATRALPIAEELQDRAARSKLLWGLMRIHVAEQNADLAVQNGEEAVALARALGLREQATYAMGDLQYAYRLAGRFADAFAALNAAKTAWRELGNQHMLADNLNQSAFLYLATGELEQAAQAISEALSVSLQSNNATQETLCYFLTAQVACERGEMEQVLNYLARAQSMHGAFAQGPMEIYEGSIYGEFGAASYALARLRELREMINSGFGWFLRDGFFNIMTRLSIQTGELAAAADALAQTQPLRGPFDPIAVFAGIMPLKFVEAELCLARGEWSQVIELLESPIAQAEAVGLFHFLPDGYLTLARASMAQGDWQSADAALQRGQALAQRMGARRVLWKIFAAQSELYAKQGDAKTAERARAQAREIIEFITAHTPEAYSIESATPLPLREMFLNMPAVREIWNEQN